MPKIEWYGGELICPDSVILTEENDLTPIAEFHHPCFLDYGKTPEEVELAAETDLGGRGFRPEVLACLAEILRTYGYTVTEPTP